MQYVKALPEPPPRRRLLSEKQKEALWTELEKDTLLYRLIVLAVNLPLRRGQLVAITEDVIDFENEHVFVIGSRLVPLNVTATRVLKAMIEDEQLPFPVRDFRKRWQTALRNAGINRRGGTREENYHFHDLRSYFAKQAESRLRSSFPGFGHGSVPAMSEGEYAHLSFTRQIRTKCGPVAVPAGFGAPLTAVVCGSRSMISWRIWPSRPS